MSVLPITRLPMNIGFSSICYKLAPKFSFLHQLHPEIHMTAMSLAAIGERILVHFQPLQISKRLSKKTVFAISAPYLFISAVYLLYQQSLKVTIIASLLFGTCYAIFKQLVWKWSPLLPYYQQKKAHLYSKQIPSPQQVKDVIPSLRDRVKKQVSHTKNPPIIRRNKKTARTHTSTLKNRVSVTDQLFQEENQGISSYIDHIQDYPEHSAGDLYVAVKHHKEEVEPYVRKPNLKGEFVTFPSRDALLSHEITRRMQAAQHLPDSDRYVGFKLTGLQKFRRCLNLPIDQKLKDHWKTALKPNYSASNIYNMTNILHPCKEMREQLKIKAQETYKLATRVTWAFNSSLNGYEFIDETDKKIQIHNATTSSNDRTATNICMMRRVDDVETEKTIAYTGRPDTKAKAIEQITFMFRHIYKTRRIKAKNGIYTFPYVVNNLLSPVTGIGLVSFDEKEATIREQKIFQQIAKEELKIDGKKVRVQPIYFSQPFNQAEHLKDVITDSHSGKGLSRRINKKGYYKLLPMAKKYLSSMQEGKQKDLLHGAIRELSKDFSSLLPEQELFNRAIICQILGIETVIHCKSSTDRTTLAIAISLIAYQWTKLNLDLIRNQDGEVIPHLILKNEIAKELMAGYCLASHQITRIARTCEGSIRGHKIGTRILGFQWASNPIAGRILPKRYTKINNVSTTKQAGAGLLSTIGFLGNLALSIPIWAIGAAVNKNPSFHPIYIKPGISPFADHLVDPSSPYVGEGEGRSLLKPEGMIVL